MSRTRITSKAYADEFSWGEACKGWTLADRTGIHVIQEWMPPSARETRHVHSQTWQLYFVLEGRATVAIADERIVVEAGEGLEIRPGVPHQMRNDSGCELEFLVISTGRPREDRHDLDSSH